MSTVDNGKTIVDGGGKNSSSLSEGRRDFLKVSGASVIAACAGASVAMLSSCSDSDSSSKTITVPDVPWQYEKVTANSAGERAYAGYYENGNGCMFGAFEGIIGELRELVGEPYIHMPTKMAIYGKGGVYGWGTLCGALNGAAAAIALISANPSALVKELYGWYSTTALPAFTPASPVTADAIVTSIANSPLCHVSVENWVTTSGYTAHSAQRSERCAQLTASVAAKTIELLNAEADALFTPAYSTPTEVATCLGCHGKNGFLDNVHQEQGTSCTNCHPADQHP